MNPLARVRGARRPRSQLHNDLAHLLGSGCDDRSLKTRVPPGARPDTRSRTTAAGHRRRYWGMHDPTRDWASAWRRATPVGGRGLLQQTTRVIGGTSGGTAAATRAPSPVGPGLRRDADHGRDVPAGARERRLHGRRQARRHPRRLRASARVGRASTWRRTTWRRWPTSSTRKANGANAPLHLHATARTETLAALKPLADKAASRCSTRPRRPTRTRSP